MADSNSIVLPLKEGCPIPAKKTSITIFLLESILLFIFCFFAAVIIGIGDPPFFDKTELPANQFVIPPLIGIGIALLLVIVLNKKESWLQTGILILSFSFLAYIFIYEIIFWKLLANMMAIAFFILGVIQGVLIHTLIRDRKERKILFILVFSLLLLNGGVSYSLNRVDLYELAGIEYQYLPSYKNLFFNSTCQPPCWERIIPGVTTRSESLSLLAKIQSVDTESIYQWDNGDISWNFLKHNTTGKISYKDGYVHVIHFSSYQANPGRLISLEESIEKFGKPEIFIFGKNNDGKHKRIIMELFYPQQGIAIETPDYRSFTDFVNNRTQDLGFKIIDPKHKVPSVFFFPPEDFYAVSEAGVFAIKDLDNNIIIHNAKEWPGFGIPLQIRYLTSN